MTMIFLNINVHAQGQGNPQAAWLAVGNDTVRTWRFTDVNNSLWVTGQTQTATLLVNQESILGIAEAFKLTADSIVAGYLSAAAVFAGILDADTLRALSGDVETLYTSSLHANTIHSTTLQSDTGRFTWLNATNLLQNGFPVVSSPWTISGSSVYYNSGNVGLGTAAPSTNLEVSHSGQVEIKAKSLGQWAGYSLQTGSSQTNYLWQEFNENKLRFWVNNADRMVIDENGKVGIGTVNPSFPLEVHGNAAITGTVFADRIAAQSHISIGQFSFINGAAQPGQADTIRTPARLVVESEAGLVSFMTDTVKLGDVRFVTEPARATMSAKEQLELTSEKEKIALEADTVTVKERMGVGRTPEVALDVVGDIRATGALQMNGGRFDSIRVNDSIAVGNTTYIGGNFLGSSNHIYSDNSSLFFQSGFKYPFNVIMNSANPGKVGIGTYNPLRKLHIYSTDNTINGLLLEYENMEPCDPFQPCPANRISQWVIEPNLTHGGIARLLFSTGSKTVMTFTDTGNVGIGTTNPSTGRLELIQSANTNSGGFSLRESGGGSTFRIWRDGSGAGSAVHFDDRDLGTVLSLKDGNVGIGTEVPAHKLDVIDRSIAISTGGSSAVPAPSGNASLFVVNPTETDSWIGFQTSGTSYDLAAYDQSSGYGNTNVKMTIKAYQILLNPIGTGGYVGIGTYAPMAKLHVSYGAIRPEQGNVAAAGINWGASIFGGAGDQAFIRYYSEGDENTKLLIGNENDPDDDISFYQYGAERLTINNGNVGIGTINPGFKLEVCGTVRARIFRADLAGCDFVFENGYPLMPIKKRKEITLKNKRLWNMKPAKEMQENGADLGELSTGLLQISEEHELYLYEYDDRIEKLEKEKEEQKTLIDKLKEENKKLDAEMRMLKQRLEKLETKK